MPIWWGTRRQGLIERCFQRLGPEEFDRLDACIARGYVPNNDELILLDENDVAIGAYSIREEKQKRGS